MNKKLILASVSTVLLALPVVILAVFDPGPIPNAAVGLNVNTIIDILFGVLWPIAVAFFIIMFVLAAFKFFTAQGKPEDIASARNFVIWGIVGVVVALLAWSIPFIVRNTLGQGI